MTTISAAVFRGAGQPIDVRPVELAPPGPHEVEVAIAAAGVCHSDLHMVRGEWTHRTPVVLGHEGSGVVTALGEGVTTLAVGDHVVLSWVPSCGECRYCLAGKVAQCKPSQEVIAAGGTLFDGTPRLSVDGEDCFHYLGVSSYAERAVVPESGAIKVRSDAPLDVIAIVGCAVATGVGAVRSTAQVPAGANVAVIGCGGVGLSCIQGARMAGAAASSRSTWCRPSSSWPAGSGRRTSWTAGTGDVVEQLASWSPTASTSSSTPSARSSRPSRRSAALGIGGAAVVVGLPPAGQTASFESADPRRGRAAHPGIELRLVRAASGHS